MQEIDLSAEDPIVLALSVSTNRVLLTLDRDFGDLIFNKRLPPPPAIVYFRFDPAYPQEPYEILLEVLDEFEILGNYTVVTRRGVRQRPLV